MKVKTNVGTINALIRITAGLTVLSWATARMIKQPQSESNLIIAMLGGMKVAEGIVRYCPVTALFEENGGKIQDMIKSNQSEQTQGQQDQLISV
ncbi:YgaP family membrane protein [Mesobacillus harenae]|uniref:YgaP family membrane protein n=1 Tax=Mesobacillus harenae TaxID=2213203 RepID=UPI0015807841|nr:DUF2892 domain-containing protein [Mesobacillus harenae]